MSHLYPRPVAAVLEYFGFSGHVAFTDARPSTITFCLACGKPISASEDVLELRAGMFSQGVAANFVGRRAEPVFLHSRGKDHCLSDASLQDALRGLGTDRADRLPERLAPDTTETPVVPPATEQPVKRRRTGAKTSAKPQ
jgi:hypothetical protein